MAPAEGLRGTKGPHDCRCAPHGKQKKKLKADVIAQLVVFWWQFDI
jgi:hypothetical protein